MARKKDKMVRGYEIINRASRIFGLGPIAKWLPDAQETRRILRKKERAQYWRVSAQDSSIRLQENR